MVIGGFLSVDGKVHEQNSSQPNRRCCYTKRYFHISSRNNKKYQCKNLTVFKLLFWYFR